MSTPVAVILILVVLGVILMMFLVIVGGPSQPGRHKLGTADEEEEV